MSELIDKIFDVEKLSAEINTILINLNSVNSAISGIKDTVKNGIIVDVRSAKNVNDLSEASKKLNDNFSKGQKEVKTWQDEVAKLQEKTKQLTDTEKLANIEIAKARLELQAAQKATKEAAIAEIELTSKNKDLAGSYNALQKDLQNAIKSYKALSGEEANSAKGKELLQKIGETQKALKASDASMGNYQRNVGNYASALEGLTPRMGGLAGTLYDIAKAAKASRDDLNKMGGDNGLGVVANPRIPAGLATIMTGLKGVGQSAIAMGKAFLANPIGVMIMAIVGAFALLNAAIKSNGQATEKLGQIMAPFKVILGLVLNFVGKLVSTFLDGVLALVNFGNAVMSLIPGLDTLAEKNKQAIELEKEKQRLIRAGIVDKAADAKEELRIAELRKKIMEKDKYSAAERLAMAKDIDKSEKAMALDDADRANKNLIAFLRDMKLKNKVQKDYTIEELQQLTDLQTAKYAEQQNYFDKTKKLASRTSSLQDEIAAENKARADEEKANNDKIIAARRRLIDSGFAIMKDGIDKELKLNAETYKRQIEDLSRSGELTKSLKANLLKAEQIEIDKIKKSYEVKNLNESIKADELILENMKRSGESTLSFEKELLKKRMEAEILAGADKFETQTKYQYLQTDLETQNAEKRAELFAKQLSKEVEALKAGYSEKERELKRQFAKGLISREDYEKELKAIQDKSAYEANAKTIELLKKQLDISELSADKKAELSKQISDLQIANENAVLDATIAANDEKVKSDQDAAKKREDVAKGLVDATMEMFGAIGDFQAQKSENRISELEKEFEKSNELFETQQDQLDNSIMSEENRKAKQIELDNKKAASDKAINDKIMAEKIKMAKWDKAQSIVQAIIATAMSVLNSSKIGFPLAIPFIALAAATGAVQVATIASQPLPAYEHGTDNHPGGLSLWGEKRPEVAVLPGGQTFIAENPTISNFDAGTKIYKSVSDYENYMAKQSVDKFIFDYEKMGEKIPQTNINLDSRGLWGIVSRQNERRIMINRKYSR